MGEVLLCRNRCVQSRRDEENSTKNYAGASNGNGNATTKTGRRRRRGPQPHGRAAGAPPFGVPAAAGDRLGRRAGALRADGGGGGGGGGDLTRQQLCFHHPSSSVVNNLFVTPAECAVDWVKW